MERIPVIVVSASAALRSRLRAALESGGVCDVIASLGSFRAFAERTRHASGARVIVDAQGLDASSLADAVALARGWDARWLTLSAPASNATTALADAGAELVSCPVRDATVAEFGAWAALELVPRLRPGRARRAGRLAPPAPDAPLLRTRLDLPARPSVLLVAASTGGPNALVQFFAELPTGFPLPVLVVQHMPPPFTRSLAQRLDRGASLDVREAEAGEALVAGRVLIAPGDRHLALERRADGELVTALDDGPPVCSCRPSADVLFHSAAERIGARALAVVLTGMGEDGLAGAGALVARGATVLAQDEASSVVWGMPGRIVQSGLASAVGAPAELAREVVRRSALVALDR